MRNVLLQAGGVYIDGSSMVKFEDCGIYSNSVGTGDSSSQGGGVYIFGGTVNFTNTQIHHNTATEGVRLARGSNPSTNFQPLEVVSRNWRLVSHVRM